MAVFAIVSLSVNRVDERNSMSEDQQRQYNSRAVSVASAVAGLIIGLAIGYFLIESLVSGIILGVGLGIAMGIAGKTSVKQ